MSAPEATTAKQDDAKKAVATSSTSSHKEDSNAKKTISFSTEKAPSTSASSSSANKRAPLVTRSKTLDKKSDRSLYVVVSFASLIVVLQSLYLLRQDSGSTNITLNVNVSFPLFEYSAHWLGEVVGVLLPAVGSLLIPTAMIDALVPDAWLDAARIGWAGRWAGGLFNFYSKERDNEEFFYANLLKVGIYCVVISWVTVLFVVGIRNYYRGLREESERKKRSVGVTLRRRVEKRCENKLGEKVSRVVGMILCGFFKKEGDSSTGAKTSSSSSTTLKDKNVIKSSSSQSVEKKSSVSCSDENNQAPRRFFWSRLFGQSNTSKSMILIPSTSPPASNSKSKSKPVVVPKSSPAEPEMEPGEEKNMPKLKVPRLKVKKSSSISPPAKGQQPIPIMTPKSLSRPKTQSSWYSYFLGGKKS